MSGRLTEINADDFKIERRMSAILSVQRFASKIAVFVAMSASDNLALNFTEFDFSSQG